MNPAPTETETPVTAMAGIETSEEPYVQGRILDTA